MISTMEVQVQDKAQGPRMEATPPTQKKHLQSIASFSSAMTSPQPSAKIRLCPPRQ